MTTIGEKKKYNLRKRNVLAKYSTSLSPDIRRKGPRGTPIANPTCNANNDPSRPFAKKRHWNNIMATNKEHQAHQKHHAQHSNTITGQHSNEHANRISKHPQQKKRKRSRNMNPSNSTAKPVTRSQTRRLSEQQEATRRDTFVVPKKHHILERPAASYTSLESVQEDDEKTKANKDIVECPYCLATISLADSKILLNAYNDIKQKDKVYHGQPPPNQTTSDDPNQQNGPNQPCDPKQLDRSTLSSIYIPTPYQNQPKSNTRRPVPLMERYSFCQLHNIELVVKPRGIELGWPTVGLFEDLKDRILCFKDELDMVIEKKLTSSYREMAMDAYKEMGQHKARSTMGRMATFEAYLVSLVTMEQKVLPSFKNVWPRCISIKVNLATRSPHHNHP
ncbi:unnamed protein product [Absidia cylindrospora]